MNERDIVGWDFYQIFGKRKADGRVLTSETEGKKSYVEQHAKGDTCKEGTIRAIRGKGC